MIIAVTAKGVDLEAAVDTSLRPGSGVRRPGYGHRNCS